MESVKELIQEFVDCDVWAVVGYSEDPGKYGHIILNDLRRAGYKVYPVNRKGGEIDGMKVFESVSELPRKVEVIDFVIPASEGKKVARACAEAGFRNIWLQPGAESDELIDLCRELRLRVVHNHCAMVEKRRRSRR